MDNFSHKAIQDDTARKRTKSCSSTAVAWNKGKINEWTCSSPITLTNSFTDKKVFEYKEFHNKKKKYKIK